MTRPRYDDKSTEFGLWLRANGQGDKIGSHLGFITSNIDYIWMDYNTGDFMNIEEKRHMGRIMSPQFDIFKIIHRQCLLHGFGCPHYECHLNRLKTGEVLPFNPHYFGFFILRFENTSPDDGRTYISILDSWHKEFGEDEYGFNRCWIDLIQRNYEKEITKDQLFSFLRFEETWDTTEPWGMAGIGMHPHKISKELNNVSN